MSLNNRKSYMALRHNDPEVVALVGARASGIGCPGRMVFVCTRNSAGSKLAAAWWRRMSEVSPVDPARIRQWHRIRWR